MRRREFIKAVLAIPVGVVMTPKTAGARISVEEDDPGYDPQWHAMENLQVFCDGTEMDFVITADSREGYVKYFDKDIKKVVREIHGRVEIKINGRHYNERA
jgi:hypothetical protein